MAQETKIRVFRGEHTAFKERELSVWVGQTYSNRVIVADKFFYHNFEWSEEQKKDNDVLMYQWLYRSTLNLLGRAEVIGVCALFDKKSDVEPYAELTTDLRVYRFKEAARQEDGLEAYPLEFPLYSY